MKPDYPGELETLIAEKAHLESRLMDSRGSGKRALTSQINQVAKDIERVTSRIEKIRSNFANE